MLNNSISLHKLNYMLATENYNKIMVELFLLNDLNIKYKKTIIIYILIIIISIIIGKNIAKNVLVKKIKKNKFRLFASIGCVVGIYKLIKYFK